MIPKFSNSDLDWNRLHLRAGLSKEEFEQSTTTYRHCPHELEVDKDLERQVSVGKNKIMTLAHRCLVGENIGRLLLESSLLHHSSRVLCK
jgi:hypothetical protein